MTDPLTRTAAARSPAARTRPARTPPVTVSTDRNPYGTLAAVGFALSMFWLLCVPALILSLMAFVRSRRLGLHSRLATAGIALSATGILVAGVLLGTAIHSTIDAAQTCDRLGHGVHVVGDSTYTCTPTSFRVTTTP